MKNDLPISTENILDHMSEGVYVCDRNRRIVFWSKSSERITGWRSEKLLGLDGFINILTDLNYPRKPLKMNALELAFLKFSNNIRLQDDITIIEGRYSG